MPTGHRCDTVSQPVALTVRQVTTATAHARVVTRDHVPSPPALKTLVLYLRPAPRHDLLAAAASLGLLVIEHQGAHGWQQVAANSRADFAIVLATGTPGDAPVLSELAGPFGPRIVTIVPDASDAWQQPARGDAGLLLRDQDLGPDFAARLVPMAHAARRARAKTGHDTENIVFGDIEFEPDPPALCRGLHRVALSRSEANVLAALCAARGRPVAHETLSRACATGGMDVHPGLLKAVILRLRRKAEDLGGDAGRLQTVRGFGYLAS